MTVPEHVEPTYQPFTDAIQVLIKDLTLSSEEIIALLDAAATDIELAIDVMLEEINPDY